MVIDPLSESNVT